MGFFVVMKRARHSCRHATSERRLSLRHGTEKLTVFFYNSQVQSMDYSCIVFDTCRSCHLSHEQARP